MKTERFKHRSHWTGESGIGLMDAIVAIVAALIVGSILLQLVRMGVSAYKLSCATGGVASALEQARGLAKSEDNTVKVVFDAKGGRFGVDRNRNNRLDNVEAEELPSGIAIEEDSVVVFDRSGKLARGSAEPSINISNDRSTRIVTVSSVGIIDIQ